MSPPAISQEENALRYIAERVISRRSVYFREAIWTALDQQYRVVAVNYELRQVHLEGIDCDMTVFIDLLSNTIAWSRPTPEREE